MDLDRWGGHDGFVEPDMYLKDLALGGGNPFGKAGNTFSTDFGQPGGEFSKFEIQNAEEAQEKFTLGHQPRALPTDPFFELAVTTLNISLPEGGKAFLPPRAPHEIGNCTLRFLEEEMVSVELLKVRQ